MYQDTQFKTLRKKLRNTVPDAERKLWQALRKSNILGYKFTRPYGVGRYVLDFYCPRIRLAIELDGSQHMEEQNQKYDEQRTEFLNSQNITVVRFYDNEVFLNLVGIIDKIISTITTLEKQ
jgi:very-short-patch-repair endonuclease